MMNNKPFGEVIESSLLGWQAQSWAWDTFPPFGSLVTIESKKYTHLGIVYQTQTGSLEAGRYPFTYQKTEEELLQEQPQIFEFLKTTFSCITVGYRMHEIVYYQLTPEPPKIHAFVQQAPTHIIRQFFSSHHYLHILFGAQATINLDELLLAILQQVTAHVSLEQKDIETFIETFSLLTSNDYRRLKLFLQRIEPLVNLTR